MAIIAGYVRHLFLEVNADEFEGNKKSFSMMCSLWLNCTDFDEGLAALKEPGSFMPDFRPYGKEAQNTLRDCVEYLHAHMQNEKPWKITEDFIYDLGFKFNMFRMMNTFYLAS